MEHIVLGLLILKDLTIYELNTIFKLSLSMIYAASYGTLQYSIKKLLKDKLIIFDERVENGRNKKIYTITNAGRESFFSWMNEDILARDVETEILSKVYFLGLIPNKNDKLKIINKMAQAVDLYLSQLENIKFQNKPVDLPAEQETIAKYQFTTLDYGIGVSGFARQWLKSLKEELLET